MRPMVRCVLLVVLIAAVPVGCAPPASRGGFNSDNPASKLYAIRRAGRSDTPQLVEQLNSDDPAVRMMSIHALEQITGTRLGYHPYGSEADRRSAIEAWVQAVRDGRFESPDTMADGK